MDTITPLPECLHEDEVRQWVHCLARWPWRCSGKTPALVLSIYQATRHRDTYTPLPWVMQPKEIAFKSHPHLTHDFQNQDQQLKCIKVRTGSCPSLQISFTNNKLQNSSWKRKLLMNMYEICKPETKIKAALFCHMKREDKLDTEKVAEESKWNFHFRVEGRVRSSTKYIVGTRVIHLSLFSFFAVPQGMQNLGS